MRIVFIGSVEFSKRALIKLIDLKVNVVALCTIKKNRLNSDYVDLRPICKKNKIPFIIVEDINSTESQNWIKSFHPDIIFCFGWSKLLKKNILKSSKMGVIGFHPTKLPENRGRHPLIWSLVLGIKNTASTFFFMNERADEGNILSQKTLKILNSDNAQSLYDKISKVALSQIEDFIPKLQNQTFSVIKQKKNSGNIWRKRSKVDGLIDFRMTSNAIYNLVRALSKPYPGAHIVYNGKEVIIWKVRKINFKKINIECGKILKISDNKILVKTYDGAIEILEHEFKKQPIIGEYL